MKVNFKNIKFLLEGGPMPEGDSGMGSAGAPAEGMPPEGGAPEQGGGDPLMQLAQMAMQALQSQDCNMMAQVCEALVQLIQQVQGGGEAPTGPAPEEQGQPVFKKGGRLAYRIK